ncbi:hypothetical protein [Streptomyces sp. NBC_00199]|uniref:hypothetical protein n=1 Tax=Streptomyces sp. NBC_00199 TaxID=2975678 RepID=UPI0022559477|nr:hypothetical protein [Streptomyces sp. NBC_00199]MCX5262438.1 hypothetical protein [Streptomyces sp. NBC_00199]
MTSTSHPHAIEQKIEHARPERQSVELLTDTDWQVVQAAAANPSLPLAVMSDLVLQL